MEHDFQTTSIFNPNPLTLLLFNYITMGHLTLALGAGANAEAEATRARVAATVNFMVIDFLGATMHSTPQIFCTAIVRV
jgi:hypothetical protein